MRTPVLFIAALATVGTTLTACGSGPNQVNSAVIICDRVITVDSVQQRLDTAAKPEDLPKQMPAQPPRIAALAKDAAGPAGPDNQSGAVADIKWNTISRFASLMQNAQPGQVAPANLLYAQLFAASPNSVIATQLNTGQEGGGTGWLVVLVRQDNAGVPANQAALASQIPAEWTTELGLHLLGPRAADIGLRVSPRYGVWDQLAVNVVPSEGEKSGVVIPASTARP